MENKVKILGQSKESVTFIHDFFEDGSPRKITLHKLHPNQEKYPGEVISMPNLPNDVYHRYLWQYKGYKANPQELMPEKQLLGQSGTYHFDVNSKRIISYTEVPSTPGGLATAPIEEGRTFKCPKCESDFKTRQACNAHQVAHVIRNSFQPVSDKE